MQELQKLYACVVTWTSWRVVNSWPYILYALYNALLITMFMHYNVSVYFNVHALQCSVYDHVHALQCFCLLPCSVIVHALQCSCITVFMHYNVHALQCSCITMFSKIWLKVFKENIIYKSHYEWFFLKFWSGSDFFPPIG